MRLLNASLMCSGINGFTVEMRKLSSGGYWELPPGTPNFNKELVRIALENKVDLIFLQVQAEGIIDPLALKTCKDACIVILNFNGDVRSDLPSWHYDVAPYCDSSLFSNMLDVRRMREKGFKSDWLELGYNPTIYRPYAEKISSPEIVFMANNYGAPSFPLSGFRYEAAQRMKKEFGENFGVYGSNWPFGSGDFNGSQPREALQYSSAKIALNISHFCIERYSSDRMIRCLGSQVMCLTHRFPDMHVIDGEHVVAFDDLDDMVIKCRYYLDHEEGRRMIAEAGHKYALENFTFEKMCENIKNLYLKFKV